MPSSPWRKSDRVEAGSFLSTSLAEHFQHGLLASATTDAAEPAGNRPERLEWFRDLGFGLFIHWGLDSQVTSIISHSTLARAR